MFRMGGFTRPIFHLILWHAQKQTEHNVLRCDPVLYPTGLHGPFQIRFIAKTQSSTLNHAGSSALFVMRGLTG
jgi:hypothetical protein